MLDNKFLIDLYVLSLDKHFEIFIPVNDKVGNIVNLLEKTLFSIHKNYSILNLYSGKIYKNNDIIRNTDIKNGTKLMLI